MRHADVLIFLVLMLGIFSLFFWFTFFPSRALDWQIRKYKFGLVLPPRKTPFYWWLTLVGGVVGMMVSGAAIVGLAQLIVRDGL